MLNIAKQIQRAENLGLQVSVSGGSSDDALMQLEHSIGVLLPDSLRDFLTSYGTLRIGHRQINGIVNSQPFDHEGSGIFASTEAARRCNYFLPKEYWVIECCENGVYCIDTQSQSLGRPGDGEFIILFFSFQNAPSPAGSQYPAIRKAVKNTSLYSHLHARNFEEYLTKFFGYFFDAYMRVDSTRVETSFSPSTHS